MLMALMKPSGVSPSGVALDANEDIVISWNNTGDRSYAYQIKIYKNSDSVLILDTNKTSSLNTFHVISAGTLTNGTEYKYTITLWNQARQTATGDWNIFRCSSTPTCGFTNVTSDSEILNSAYTFQGSYNQVENVPIRSWLMILYDMNDYILSISPETFSDVIEYEFAGLNNDSDYQIELQVKSQDNLLATTGKVQFHVRYEVPASSISLQAESVSEKAAVRLLWNTTQIIGHATQGSFVYIDNEKIDLRNGTIVFDESMPNFRNFESKSWFSWVDLKNEIITQTISTCLGDVDYVTRDAATELLRLKTFLGDIWVEWEYEDDTGGRFHVWKNMYGQIYHITSSLLSPIVGDTVYLGVSYNGNLCDVYAQFG